MKKPRLTFFLHGEDSFLKDIIINLRNDYDIKYFNVKDREREFYSDGSGTQEFYQLYYDSDIAWFEWCNELVIKALSSPKQCKHIVRLHSYEMFTPMPSQVDWNKVDKLIVVSETMKNLLDQKFHIRKDIFKVINNGINLEKFDFNENKKYNKKICYLGYLNYKKAPELFLHFCNEIWNYDHNFTFHIAGQFQDERIGLYMNTIIPHLPFKVIFDGWQKNVPEYLSDKDYIMSTSLFESFHYSLMEGMALGVIPLVHGWIGSELLYPTENIFYRSNDLIDFIKKIESSENIGNIRKYHRKYVENNFSLDKQMKEIKETLSELL